MATGKILVIADQRYLFSALWGFSFWMIAFSWTFLRDIKTLSSNFLPKSEGIHQSSQKFLLCYQICFSCLIIVGKVANLLLTFVFCMIFFPCSFHIILALIEVVIVHKSFSIVFLLLLNISWRTALIKNLFWMRYFLWSLSLLCIGLRIAVVIHGFLSACGNLFISNISTKKN